MKLAVLAAAAAATLIALPAVASDLRVATKVVRISVTGKTDAQVGAEIRAAANTVCGATSSECVDTAVREANNQYAAIQRAHRRDAANAELTKVDVVREDRATIRVKVAGRSLDQVNADIEVAAKTVCKVVNSGDYRNCVTHATRSAKAQLRQMAQAAQPEQVASR